MTAIEKKSKLKNWKYDFLFIHRETGSLIGITASWSIIHLGSWLWKRQRPPVIFNITCRRTIVRSRFCLSWPR